MTKNGCNPRKDPLTQIFVLADKTLAQDQSLAPIYSAIGYKVPSACMKMPTVLFRPNADVPHSSVLTPGFPI